MLLVLVFVLLEVLVYLTTDAFDRAFHRHEFLFLNDLLSDFDLSFLAVDNKLRLASCEEYLLAFLVK